MDIAGGNALAYDLGEDRFELCDDMVYIFLMKECFFLCASPFTFPGPDELGGRVTARLKDHCHPRER